jgi:hypothetical protein
MLRNQISEFLHRLRLLNFLRWAIKDSIGRITVLGFCVVASFIIQLNDLELDYGLQRLLHLLSIGGPFLVLTLCLTSREMWVKLPPLVSFVFVLFIVLIPVVFVLFIGLMGDIRSAFLIQTWLIAIPLILILIFWPRKDLRSNPLLRAGYILGSTTLSGILILLILPTIMLGFPNTLVNRTYKSDQSVISVYESTQVGVSGGDRTCRQRIEQKQIFPGILAKRGELNKECGDKESDYSADFRSKS